MPEHRIRLRGGWRCYGTSDAPTAGRPTTLPIHWPQDAREPLRLVRRFGIPTVDRAREVVTLVAEDVPGLLSARLNDEPVLGPEEIAACSAFELRGLLTRNELVLEVDPVRALAQPSGQSGWGQIALVVRRVEETPPGPPEAAMLS